MNLRRSILATLGCTVLFAHALAEAPVPAAAPKRERAKIVDIALSYRGSPYLYGGADAGGFDCSGFVYRVYLQSLGARLPRTAREQFDFREPIAKGQLQAGDLLFFDTTGQKAHVGIYEGDGLFIHSASEGPRRGIIESSLSESYWARTYSGAGRIIPPAEYLGLIFSASLGASLGSRDFLRGVRGSFGVAYRLLGIEAGLELRPEYDATLGAVRLPAVLALGLDRRLKLFAGPAITLGSPSLGGTRSYRASGGLLATMGVEFTPFRFRLSGLDAGLTGELVYNRYVSEAGADLDADAVAGIRAGIGFSARLGI
jgi:probable lipoprotein NlpC